MRTDPAGATMPRIAERAGLSAATAYRYFPALSDLLNAYLYDVYVQLRDFSHSSRARGMGLHTAVVGEWIRLVGIYGRSMVQLRPRSGLLDRLDNGDPVIQTSREAWERPIRALLRANQLPDEMFEPAFFLQNMMFDAREVLDLLDRGMSTTQVTRNLQSALVGAVQGWHEAS